MQESLKLIILLIALSQTAVAADYTRDYMRPAWNYTLPEVISDIYLDDLDGDGDFEVSVSASSSGQLHVVDRRGEKLWQYNHPGYLHATYIADINADGKKEVFASTGDRIHVLTTQGELYDRFYTSNNPSKEIDAGDLDGDGSLELVATAYDVGACEDNYVFAFDHEGEAYATTYNTGLALPFALSVSEIDGSDHVLVGLISRARDTASRSCRASYDAPGKLIVFDEAFTTSWEYETRGGVTAIHVADLEGDASPEILVGSYPTLYVLSKRGRLKWSFDGVSLIHAVTTADLTGDGTPEVIVASDHVYVLDAQGSQLWRGYTDDRVYSLAVSDLDGDGTPEVVAGSDHVYVFSAAGEKRWDSPNLVTVDDVYALDLDRDGHPEVVARAVRAVHVYKTKTYAQTLSAEGLLSQATESLAAKRYAQAMEQARRARELYADIGELEGMARAINVYNEANQEVRSLSEQAGDLLSRAKQAYGAEDFINATYYGRQASQAYRERLIASPQKVLEADQLVERSIRVLRRNATAEMEAAKRLVQAEDLAGARAHALAARDIYLFLEDENEAEKANRIVAAGTTTRDRIEGAIEQARSLNVSALLPEEAPTVKPAHLGLTILAVAALGVIFIVVPYTAKNTKSRLSRRYLKPRDLAREATPPRCGKVSRASIRRHGCTLPMRQYRRRPPRSF